MTTRVWAAIAALCTAASMAVNTAWGQGGTGASSGSAYRATASEMRWSDTTWSKPSSSDTGWSKPSLSREAASVDRTSEWRGSETRASNPRWSEERESDMRWSDVTLITVVAFLMSIVATIYPAWRASRTQPAEALRYE